MRNHLCLTITLSVALALAQAARADTVVLKSGGRIEGEVAIAEGPAATYRVKTALGTITLGEAQVERVIALSPAQKNYQQFLLKMPDDLDGHWKMAEWCRENGLNDVRKTHLEKVIAFDPEHEGARRALGYSKLDGRWRRVDEVMLSRGYVRHRGAWRLPQEVLLETRADDIELKQKDWRKKIKMWRGWIGAKRGNEAVANIRSIDDPLAAMALAELLLAEKNSDVKLLYIDVLGRLPSSTAIGALIQASLDDDDDTVREACLSKLSERGAPQAVSAYSKVLKGVGDPKRQCDISERTRIHRAAEGLGRMGDPHSVKTLIDALFTTYRAVVAPGGNLGVSFGGGTGGGGGGLSAGSKPVVLKEEQLNQPALDSLIAITGENFGANRDQWKAWYAKDRTPPDVDLRRGGF